MTATPAADFERLRGALGERYQLVRELGHGGMAVVYLARDTALDREIALKVLRPEVAALLGADRFVREIRITASLRHPNILPLHESGDAAGQPYYTMPYLPGETLRARLEREGPLPVPDAIGLAREVADALAHAHSQGIVHRDIKPENILLSDGHAIVADFGIARALEAAGGESLTGTGMAVGTAQYMSPEQASASNVDGRTDVYALGCVLYEMLAGEPPFTGRTVQAVLARHLSDRPPSLQTVRPTLDGSLLAVIDRALAKIPADRFATAADFGAALRDIAEHRAPVIPLPAPGRPRFRFVIPAAIAVLAAGFAAWRWLGPSGVPLDQNRVLVFPVSDPAGLTGPQGQAIAAYVGYALESSEPLRWEEGGTGDMFAQARRRGAAWAIDGSILRDDSVTVLLRLHSVGGDSLVGRAARTGPPGVSEARLAVLAAGDLLPRMLASGRAVDLTPLADRAPAAIANFLQGEREYAAAEFARALPHYQDAVAADSQFALAAVKGAQAASWLDDTTAVRSLITTAMRTRHLLPRRYALFTEGLQHYADARADSAVAKLRQAVALAPDWSEAWMALGESYYHLAPFIARPDTLAAAAFAAAHENDAGFAPALYHLAELALRRGDLRRARVYQRDFLLATRDTALSGLLATMIAAARGRIDSADWVAIVRRSETDALNACVVLTPVFARDGEACLRAVLFDDSTGTSARFASLFALQNMLLAQGRYADVRRLLSQPPGNRGRFFLLSDAPAHDSLAADAARLADSIGAPRRGMTTVTLWLLGVHHASRGSVSAATAVSALLDTLADSTALPRDHRLAEIVQVHLGLARGDTTDAIRRLRLLQPTAARPQLAWGVWQPLGYERLTLARLLAARNDHRAAIAVADMLDATAPAAYVAYQPASLDIRERSAQALGDAALARTYQARRRP